MKAYLEKCALFVFTEILTSNGYPAPTPAETLAIVTALSPRLDAIIARARPGQVGAELADAAIDAGIEVGSLVMDLEPIDAPATLH